MVRPYPLVAERLAARLVVNPATGCHEYDEDGRGIDGYGRITVDGHSRLAHRVAWELAHGPIPDGMFVCHRCDNPPCCNLDHLFLGTHADNMRDCAEKGRAHPGERHGLAKLTDDQAAAIIRRRRAGERGVDLAAEYGVTTRTITRIVRGENWGHLDRPVVAALRKLTAAQVAQIKALRAAGATLASIGQRFGVGSSMVAHIEAGRCWAHVEPDQATLDLARAVVDLKADRAELAAVRADAAALSRQVAENRRALAS